MCHRLLFCFSREDTPHRLMSFLLGKSTDGHRVFWPFPCFFFPMSPPGVGAAGYCDMSTKSGFALVGALLPRCARVYVSFSPESVTWGWRGSENAGMMGAR